MTRLDQKRRGRVAAGLVGLLLSGLYTAGAVQLPFGELDQPGPAIFPLFAGVVFAAISLYTVWEAWRTEAVTGSVDLPAGPDRRRVMLLLLALVAYVLVLPVLGQLLASVALVAALLWLLGGLGWVRIVALSLAISLPTYWFFIEVLGVRMPRGILGF